MLCFKQPHVIEYISDTDDTIHEHLSKIYHVSIFIKLAMQTVLYKYMRIRYSPNLEIIMACNLLHANSDFEVIKVVFFQRI